MEHTDKEFIERYFKGDEEAFQMLVKRYLQPIYNFVFSSVRDAHHSEDITQEIFVKIWSHLKSFDTSKSFKVWIYAIAKNSIFDFFRKKKTVPFSALEKEEEIFEVQDVEPLPDKILKQKDMQKILDAALEKIPLLYRQVLLLYYRDGFNLREISEVLKTSFDTVKSRHRRALFMLKKILKNKDLL